MRCTRLPVTASKEERLNLHRTKMEMKRQRNAQYGPTGFGYPIKENKRDRSQDEEQAVGA